MPLSLLVTTAAIYAIAMLAPAEQRAALYLPSNLPPHLSAEQIQHLTDLAIERNGLDDPFPVQYGRWAGRLLRGEWGWSPILRQDVLAALLTRVPDTAELALFATLVFLPLGLISGALAGAQRGRPLDAAFRLAAFASTSIPPFILGLLLLALFYVAWPLFPPGRLSLANDLFVRSDSFRSLTGFLTVDGLLNGRPDISLDALRHLVLPVATIGLLHWATLGRITRAALIETLQEPHATASLARGLPRRRVIWRHAFRLAAVPGLTSSALSAASLVTGVFVVEIIFGLHGISELAVAALGTIPDASLAVGFSVFCVLLVLPLMLALDLAKAALDPRIREGVLRA
jgi:peptide/nickel transport system permease protein